MHELGDREPASREGEMILAIFHAHQPVYYSQPNTTNRTVTACGMNLHPGFVNRVDVKKAMNLLVRANVLTWRQGMVLWHRYAKDHTQEQTAKHLHISTNTVKVDEVRGLEILIGYVWKEPDYKSPPRTRSLNPTRDPIKGMERATA